MAEASNLKVLDAISNGRLSFDDALQLYDGPLRAVSLSAAAFYFDLHLLCSPFSSLLCSANSDMRLCFAFGGNRKANTPTKVRETLNFSRQVNINQ